MSVNSKDKADIINESCNILQDCYNPYKKQCKEQCVPNHSYNITSTSICQLNDDCLMLIFVYLPITDRIRIERVCKRWKALSEESWYNIKKLDLQNSTWGFSSTIKLKQISTIILRKVLLRCGKFLNEIQLAKIFCEDNKSGLSVIGKLCPNLQILNVSHLQVTSTGIMSLAKNCHNIRELSLDCICLSDTDLGKLFKVNQKLRYLKLVENETSGKCLLHLPSETMETIIIERCDYICDDDVAEAVVKFKNLKCLIIEVCFNNWKKTTEAVGKYCTNLKTLEIIGNVNSLQYNGISYITSLIKLKKLKVTGTWLFCNSILYKLRLHCQELTYLDLRDVSSYLITDYTLAVIEKFPKLEILMTRDLYQVTSKGLMHLCNLKQLVCQQCNFFDITVSNLIRNSLEMEVLDLSGCYRISNVTLERAVTATKFRTNNVVLNLFIGGTSVNLETFIEVSPLLRILDTDLRYKLMFSVRPDSFLN